MKLPLLNKITFLCEGGLKPAQDQYTAYMKGRAQYANMSGVGWELYLLKLPSHPFLPFQNV